MAATGERLASLRAELACLEADADEVYLIEMKMLDVQPAASRAGELRRRVAVLEAEAEQVCNNDRNGCSTHITIPATVYLQMYRCVVLLCCVDPFEHAVTSTSSSSSSSSPLTFSPHAL